ncbi:hypothetical protein L1887_13442 [Cichorium endivia]|nr:hypothetical protein L1887_13442 [Cichorium endivia]
MGGFTGDGDEKHAIHMANVFVVFATQAALLVVFLISTFTFLFYFLSLRIWLCTRETLHLKHPKWLDGTLRFAAVGRRRRSSSGSKSLIPPWRTHNL